jgi:hypothetical protein
VAGWEYYTAPAGRGVKQFCTLLKDKILLQAKTQKLKSNI